MSGRHAQSVDGMIPIVFVRGAMDAAEARAEQVRELVDPTAYPGKTVAHSPAFGRSSDRAGIGCAADLRRGLGRGGADVLGGPQIGRY